MSRFFSQKYAALTPYTPGEQPKDRKFIKLNTNESPFPPSAKAQAAAAQAASRLHLYSDPECTPLHAALAQNFGLRPSQVLATNGSDEILNFAFMAFCDATHPAVFPDITYGFYPVFAKLNGVPYREIPLCADLTVDLDALRAADGTLFLANPNAPTGIALPRAVIEALVREKPDRVVVVDEAYVDFGAESCVPLIDHYENLLVTQTFSKSRSMAGARLGFGLGCESLIRDLNTIKYSTNPYNINSMTMAAGVGALADEAATRRNCAQIAQNREATAAALTALGFEVLPSKANFLFVKHPQIGGAALNTALRAHGILVRHFTLPRIADYNRITIGTADQMQQLLTAITAILEEPT